jgi:hypothetical protein
LHATSLPPTTSPWWRSTAPTSFVNDFSLNDPFVVIRSRDFSLFAAVKTLPFISFAFLSLHSFALALDFADPLFAFAADFFGEVDEFEDVFLGGC